MKNSKTHVTKLVFLAMMVALGVVISPILRVEGMCPMAHFINVTCAVMLGPWYAFVCALAIGIIRMVCMGIPPLALTGAVFGAFLSGMLYRLSKGKLVCAFIGEVIGTGIIGSYCFLSCYDTDLGTYRSYLVLLCAILYCRYTDRRQPCFHFLKAFTESPYVIHIPDCFRLSGLH